MVVNGVWKVQKIGIDTDLRPEIKVFEWNELTNRIQKLINLKHNHSALSYGDYTQIGITNTACIYQRQMKRNVYGFV